MRIERKRIMEIGFMLNEHETEVTPMSTAMALTKCGQFDSTDIREIIAYLSIYVRYNPTK